MYRRPLRSRDEQIIVGDLHGQHQVFPRYSLPDLGRGVVVVDETRDGVVLAWCGSKLVESDDPEGEEKKAPHTLSRKL